MKQYFFCTAIAIAVMLSAGCSPEEGENPLPGQPVITLDSPTSIYTVKVGREIEIQPTYENADEATFAWRMDGKLLGEETTLRFSSEQSGRYFITLTVTNRGGKDEEELRVDVFDLTPPTISLPGADKGFILLFGSELELKPQVASSLETAYSWTIDGEEVSTEQNYTFAATETGDYTVRFATGNEDGDDAVEFTVSVREANEVDFKWAFEQTEYNVAKGRTIRLRAIGIENAFTAQYAWSVDGETVQQGNQAEYAFTAAEEGVHVVKLEMQNEYLLATQTLTVNVCPEEGTFYRSKTAASSAACNKVYKFLPAPGQFVNENYTATDMTAACAYAEERMAQSAYVSLGGFGGYMVVGFDHSIDNDGDYNIAVTGNAFNSSSEPGVIWVMQDENGDGLPNDTWYELKGSEYGKEETIQDYTVTYYRPSAPGQSVPWTDNRGNSGSVEHLGAYHRQDYYYPAWVEADNYTLRGTRLKSRSYDQSGNGTYWVNPSFDWGYADNFSSIDRLTDNDNYNAAPADNHFKISHAVTFDGKNAGLEYIDFVKIQVALNQQCGWIGEVSTEVFGVKDFNMSK
ncbi:MAG: cell surface protein [Tannerella sp.]|jgi:PKD repeat protein|nr:cell surface protein [Tannerella sp.]